MSRKRLSPLREAKTRLKYFLDVNYPDVIHTFQGYIPKFFIPIPRGRYHGLFLEIRGEGNKSFTIEGRPTKHDTYAAKMYPNLQKLEDCGFKVVIVKGFPGAKKAIEEYLKNNVL